jgi:hypothetical protein
MRQPKGRRNDTAVGERNGNGSRGICFHTTGPENGADYFTVRVELISGTPTIQELISCFHRVFIVDTGSSISLIQPRVYSSDVSPTNVSPFGVTGNQLEIQGTQKVKFHLNRREFCHQFCVCLLSIEANGILVMDFFAEKNAELDLGKLQLRLKKGASGKHGYENQRMRQARSEAGYVAITVFTKQKDQFSRVGCIPEDTRDMRTQVQEGTQNPLYLT